MILHICLSLAVQDYHVSASGSDGNPGTSGSPWKTIQKAATTATAGSTVHIHAGTYNERVTIGVSGVTFTNAGDGAVVIDGTGLSVSGGAGALVWIDSRSDLVLDGLEIANYSTTNASDLIVGVYVTGSGTNLALRNLNVHHIRNAARPSAGNAHGIAVYGTSGTSAYGNIVIDGCTVANCALGSSEAVALNGNVDGFQVTNNTVHDNNNIGIVLIGWEGTAPANDQARNGVVRGNRVSNITSFGNPAYGSGRSAGGIYVDGGRDIVIERNIVSTCDLGIEVGCEHGGMTASNVRVRDNVLYRNNVVGLIFGGYDATRGFVLNCTFTNNTLYQNDTTNSGSGEILIQKSHDNTIRQNILFTSGQKIAMTNPFGPANSYANSSDWNLVYAPGGAATSFEWQQISYASLLPFRGATGQEANSLFGDPMFVNSGGATPDVHLQPGSPAIDSGDPSFVAASGETDLDGGARIAGARVDIGADEAGSSSGGGGGGSGGGGSSSPGGGSGGGGCGATGAEASIVLALIALGRIHRMMKEFGRSSPATPYPPAHQWVGGDRRDELEGNAALPLRDGGPGTPPSS